MILKVKTSTLLIGLFLAIALPCAVISTSFAAIKEKRLTLVVEGSERVDNHVTVGYVDVRGLKKNDPQAINSSLKNLYESGLFAEVQIYKSGRKMVIKVKENPLISDVKFEGNKKVGDEMLEAEVRLKKRSIYTKDKLQADIKRINDIYIKSGRFLAKIDPKIVKKDQNRVELIFQITEGKKASISDIYFIGNDSFSKQDLIEAITSREGKWYKFFSSADSYDSDRIEFDREKLRRFYNSKGYADFNVISAIAQISKEKDKFFISFLLEEGIKYDLGEVNIVNNVRKFDEGLLKKAIKTKSGKVYNGDLVDKTIDEMVEIMSEKGYAFANIEPVLKRNKEKKIIDIDYVVSETPRVYINRIIISGNTRTLDEVIRREMRVREGDPYNITRINRSKQRITNLGFFEKVELSNSRVGDANLVDLKVEVRERKTGELNFGIGYSTVDKAVGNVGIKERNLMGTGQELSFNVQKSSSRFSTQISYTKPYFTGREIYAGVDLFNYESGKLNTLVYDQNSKGITLRASYAATEYFNHQLRYSYSNEKISDIDEEASEITKSLEGDYKKSGIGHTISSDNRDNRFDPGSGYYLNFSQDYVGIGGNVKYVKNEGAASYYLPVVTDDFVLKLGGRFGYIDGVGQPVRSNDNFFLGGNNFRGFEYAGIGPRAHRNGSAVGGDAVGGKLYYVGTTEFRFPIGLPKDLGINTSIFSDFGSLRLFDRPTGITSDISDSGSLRVSYGFSLIWTSPMGPLRLDFSKIGKSEEYDRKETFRLNFGTTF